MLSRALVIAAAFHALALSSWAAAQSGVPGGRIETARDHRSAVHAETYVSVASFMSRWREVWQARNAEELIRLYAEDASVRLPGQVIVRGRAALTDVLPSAIAAGAPIAMADVDFHTDGEMAILVSCYFTQQENRDVTGVVTAVLLRTSRSWRFRLQVFDVPQPASSASQRFSC